MRLAVHALLAMTVAACGGSAPAPEADAGGSCDLSVGSLAGKTFVELEVQADKSDKPNPMARMKFGSEGGKTTVSYTVKNGLHAYPYTCSPSSREGELVCVTEPDFERACLSLEVHKQGSCTPEGLKAVGLEGDADEITKDIAAAKERYAKAEKQREDILKESGKDAADRAWKGFEVTNNNVANPAQALLYVKIDKARCRLQVDDMQATIYDGKRVEDFNPVGSNPFVPSDEELLFDDCDNERMLLAYGSADLPASLEGVSPMADFAAGSEVYYHYLGDVGVKAEDGCTYSADVWANWRPADKAKAVPVTDGKVDWRITHTWTPADQLYIGAVQGVARKGGFFHVTRYKECGGKKERIDSLCTATGVTL